MGTKISSKKGMRTDNVSVLVGEGMGKGNKRRIPCSIALLIRPTITSFWKGLKTMRRNSTVAELDRWCFDKVMLWD